MRDCGSVALGAGIAAAIALVGGCARNHGAAIDAGPSSGAREPLVIGEAQPLGEELSFAFKAGYHAQEQIWLRGANGALTRVSSWALDPEYEDSCGEGWSTIGYTGGRFGRMQLDAQGEHLLFTETRQCHGARNEWPSRVLAHELASGITRVLLETRVRPDIVVGAGTAVAIVRRSPETYPSEPIPKGGLELYEVVGGELEPIAVVQGDDWQRVVNWEGGYLVRWNDRILLFVDGVPAFERVAGGWQRSELGEPLAGAEIHALAGAPSGTRLCASTSRVEGGRRQESVVWVLEPDGQWISAPLPIDWASTCSFAPDESKVVFGSAFYALQDEKLSPMPFEGNLAFRGTWRGELYGIDVDARAIVRADWSTMTVENALAVEELPELCANTFTRVSPILYLPPDDRPLALLKASCGCTDCDISGSLAWHSETGGIEMIEDVWGEHDVYGFAWLADGGAVVLSTQTKRDANGEEVARPERGQYFLVSADGTVETLGPLPAVEGVLHSPVSLPPRR